MSMPDISKELLKLIAEANIEDDVIFRDILEKTIAFFNYNNADIAHMFSVSIPTVGRWRKKTTTPHPLMRKSIYTSISDLVRPICTKR